MNPAQPLERALRRIGARTTNPTRTLGIVAIVLLGILAAGLYNKAALTTFMRGGDTVSARFASDYQLVEDKTKVKAAGLVVGVVSDVEHEDSGVVLVTMKVDEDVASSLGTEPTAVVAPKTLLGGEYAVELFPGGAEGKPSRTIPVSRTSLPTELDRILEALPGSTRRHLQSTVGRLDRSLETGGSDALRELAREVPRPMEDGGEVLKAMPGKDPDDLRTLVLHLDDIADVLSRQNEDLDEVTASGAGVTAALGRRDGELARSVEKLPDALRSSKAGLASLSTMLDEIERTAPKLKPTVVELDPLLEELEPVLVEARPVVRRLRTVMADARPVTRDLVPTVRRAGSTLTDVRGPVLDRVNGPILDVVMNTWRGEGPYARSGGGSQGDHKFYEELGYLVSNMDRASMTQDSQGSLLSFQVGVSGDVLGGLPLNLPNLLAQLGLSEGSNQ